MKVKQVYLIILVFIFLPLGISFFTAQAAKPKKKRVKHKVSRVEKNRIDTQVNQDSGQELQLVNIKNIKVDRVETLSFMENNCFSCHVPHQAGPAKLAPDWREIKNAYLAEAKNETKLNSKDKKINLFKQKAHFVTTFSSFVASPEIENSKMPGSIKKFDLMPQFSFPEKDIQKVAYFIFDTDLYKKDWFVLTKADKETIQQKQQTDLEKSINFAMRTKQVLGKNLLNAINNGGAENALLFCSTRAIPLTDSVSKSLNASIKRVSDKARNPQNQANPNEQAYIEKIKKLISQNKKIEPVIREENNTTIAYIPIETNKMCLQCHGDSKIDISTKTLQNIKSKYPNDKAIGYKENEIRGIFVVKIAK